MVVTANVTSTGTLVSTSATLLGLFVVAGASAGSVVLKDGGGSGTTRLTVQTPAGAAASFFLPLNEGLFFNTDIHATLTQAVGVTAVYRT